MSGAKSQQAGGPSVARIYLLGGVVCAAISAGAFFFGVRPALARHEEQQNQRAEFLAAKQKAANLNGTRTRLLAELDAVTKSLNNLPLQLEPASTVNQRIARLTQLTGECKLNIDEIRALPPVEAADYQTVPIVVAGSGTYTSVAKFLHVIRQTFPDTAVRSFETTNNSASPDAPAATFQFDLVWHAAKG
jgi:Tfp pilus assembly protein PilO